ncbi:hypothetical protein N185_16425 [Sinorhizobium sp. GW3]|nr:hypothetical protein N185_16425 [Sinorhizobium sp. GW3]
MSTDMDEKWAIQAAKLLQVLAHPKRLLLLSVLSGRSLPAGRLAAAIGLPPGMVYKHLHQLTEIGVLCVDEETASMRFSLASDEIVSKLLDIQAAAVSGISMQGIRRRNAGFGHRPLKSAVLG